MPLQPRPFVEHLAVYEPGRPLEEVARAFGFADVSGLIKLASNENLLGPSPRALDAMRASAAKMHLYPDGGCHYLRQELAARLGVEPAKPALGAGSNEISNTLLASTGRVLLPYLDLLLLIGLHPKLVVMTNSWVYNNPVYGGLVRAAGYLPGFEETNSIVEKARETIDQGYSILVFPEGTRSIDGKIKRFHKGAFFLAEELDVPIYPVVLHEVNVGLTKGDQHIKSCTGTLNALPAINGRDTSWGESYTIRTKNINKMMREELDRIAIRMETPIQFDTLRKNYLFKGPVTYWYAKIKTINENLYKQLNDLIPRNAKITDLGCGYGMMDLMLSLCSAQRSITGIDYDEDKIDLANNNFSVAGRDLHFINADIITYALEESDVFLLYDCLHYLNEPEQVEL